MNQKNKKIIFGMMVCLVALQLIFLADALIVKNVESFPGEIAPGENAELSIEIENDGENTLEDVSVSLVFSDPIGTMGALELPFAPYQSSSEKSIEELEEDEEKTLRFWVQALSDAKAGVYKIPIVITYKEDEQIKTKSSVISLIVNSKPVLDIEKPEDLFLKGQSKDITVRIVNKGLSDVRFLTINLEESMNYDILSGGSIYIGNLDSDDFDSAEFKVYFKENSPSSVNLQISLEYRDALTTKYEEDFSINVKVYSREQALKLGLIEKSYTGITIGIVVGIIVLYLIYRSWKKRRKRRLALNK